MDHYLDLQLLPDPELAAPHLMSALFARLHLRLAALQAVDVGISFPGAPERATGLGAVMRLHSSAAALDRLMSSAWLGGAADHVRTGSFDRVPDGTLHRVVRRVQVTSSAERLRRRYCKRHAVSIEVARERIPASVEQRSRLPYIEIRSRSTGQAFRLFIEQGPQRAEAVGGTFSTYGLSQHATVPWF